MESGVKTLLPSNPEKLAKRASPWGTPVPPQAPFSLAAVIDEELAKQLQTEEEEAVERYLTIPIFQPPRAIWPPRLNG